MGACKSVIFDCGSKTDPVIPPNHSSSLTTGETNQEQSLLDSTMKLSPYMSPNTKPLKSLCRRFLSKSKKSSLKLKKYIWVLNKPYFASSSLAWVENLELSSAESYSGETKNTIPHGIGTIYSTNKRIIYTGQFLNGQKHGWGKYLTESQDLYEGHFENDQMQGYGEILHHSGQKYMGEWVNSKQHGKGKEEWNTGSTFEGCYSNGKKHGVGTLVFKDGGRYVGEFIENEISGAGIFFYKDGKKYSGEWKGNKINGKGVMTWPDGKKYEGEFIDDKKHGFGTFVWNHNKKYVGGWVNGKQHGEGTTYKDGEVSRGEWDCGKFIRSLQ